MQKVWPVATQPALSQAMRLCGTALKAFTHTPGGISLVRVGG